MIKYCLGFAHSFLLRYASDDLLWNWAIDHIKDNKESRLFACLNELRRRKSSNSQMYYYLLHWVVSSLQCPDSSEANCYLEKAYGYEPVGEHARFVRQLCQEDVEALLNITRE